MKTNRLLFVLLLAGCGSTVQPGTLGIEGNSCSDPNLIPSNIISTATIAGVTGTADFASMTGSTAARTLATLQITTQAEVTTYATTALPSGYRDIPNIYLDDDGGLGNNVTVAARPTVPCGTLQTTIAARIINCNLANGDTVATWNGAAKGDSSEGTWKLVTYVGPNGQYAAHHAEVWQDQRTGLIWSSLVAGTTLDNWCRAAGNAQGTDPSGYCFGMYQPLYPQAESYCAESATIPAVASEAVGSVLGGAWSGTYLAAKGGMGAQSSASAPAVRWRLPTMFDYYQAHVDGILRVMPDMGPVGTANEWTATLYSGFNANAWLFDGVDAATGFNSRTGNAAVRCVGR
jgi:hypothetical protein